MTKSLLVLVLLGFQLHVWATVPVYLYSSGNMDEFYIKADRGLTALAKSLSEHCNIDVEFKIKKKTTTTERNIQWEFAAQEEQVKTPFGLEPLIYYEKPFLKYLELNKMLQPQQGIHIHYISFSPKHCGYAFPAIQFEKLNSKILKSVFTNNVVINYNTMDCGSQTRLLGHEMAHILIQDDPPHICGKHKCDENNILSVFRYSRLDHFRAKMPKRPFEERNNHEDLFPKLVPSTGWEFNANQCESVKRTLKEI